MMRKLIFPVLTSILALASLKNGHPRMRDIPRLPSMSRTTKSANMKVSLTRIDRFFNDSLGISYGRVGQLHTHHGREKSRIT